MGDSSDGAEELEDRLQRLAERRRLAAQRHTLRSSSSDEGEAQDAPPSRLPQGSALQALRELLQERHEALQAAGADVAGIGGAAAARRQGATVADASPSAVAAAAAVPGSTSNASWVQRDAEVPPASSSGAHTGGLASVPATARALISLSSAIGQQEALAERCARAAEAREAETAVREAEAQRAELEALLLRQEAAAAERQRQRLEWEGELQRVQLEWATQHMAAWRIAQAWRCFLRSPGRLREVAAATAIQAAWRGSASRQRTAIALQRHREQRALLAELHAAVAACDLAQAQHVAGRLGSQACSAAAAQSVAGLERRAAEAAAAVHSAAATGTADAYRLAAAAAARYSHLAAAVQEAARVFAARVAAAEQAVASAVEGGPAVLFSEAAAAAAALGVSQAVLQRAEQQVAARNQRTAEALQAALDAEPFNADAFASSLQQARQLGLHAAAARAERGLQLRRHRAAAALQQVAAEGGAAEVEAVCRSSAQLGLGAQAEAAAARLEQRQAAAAEELRQAAHSGTLQQYQEAVGQADVLQVSAVLQRTCREQLRQRQQEAEQQLRQAADRGELPAVRRRCQAALALGLEGALAEAEQRVNERRMAAAEQLAASTRDACGFATAQADGSQCGGSAAQLLDGWLSDVQQLVRAIAQHGAAAALARLPPACSGWPAELRCWLVDASRAAGLELKRAVGAAAATLMAHLEALLAAAVVVPIELQPTDMSRSTSTASPCLRGSAGQAQRPQACLQQWRQLQHDVLPLVAALAGGEEQDDVGGGAGPAGGRGEEGRGSTLDLSGQGLCSLELLAGASGITCLDLSGNALTSLEPLRALRSLQELRVAANRLGTLQGVESLPRLTLLDASGNALERLPSLEALSALHALDLSGNRLTAAALLAAHFPACGARLTALRLSGNCLADVASWMGPLPSLLHLDVSGNVVESLDGLAAAAPLLQVLVASRNRVTALPPGMHLPFLRELWLGGNRLSGIAAWPWLPSLQLLQLEDNQLAQLAPMQGFPSLRLLDLSFNALPSLSAVLSSLEPLGGPAGGLQQLRLNDNPLAGAPPQPGRPGQWGAGGHEPAVEAAPAGYRSAVLQALPQLRELDSQPIDAAERQRHLKAAAMRSRAAAGVVVAPGVGAAGKDWGPERQAQTVLWLLTQPRALQLLEESDAQQQALATATFLSQVAGQPACTPGAAGMAAALTALQQAASCGSSQDQQHASSSTAAALRVGGSRAPALSQHQLRRAQQLYLLLAGDDTGAAQDLLWLNPEHYSKLLGRLHSAATRIQAAWRCLRAVRLRQRLAAEQRASTVAAAAACVQAAWHGWVCRHCSHTHVQARLHAWRQEWQAAERLVVEHQQRGAAVRIQAVWRGWRVRRLLAQARCSLQHPGEGLSGSTGQQAGWELDSDLSTSSLDGLLEGCASSLLRAFEAPEALLPELLPAAVADGPHGGIPGLHPWGRPGSGGRGDERCSSTAGCWPPGAPSSKEPLQLPQLSAAKLSPIAPPSTDRDWQFDDPATAAAFMQLRQRQAAAVRKRTLQQQRRDPAARLHEFQVRNGLDLPSCASGPCSQRPSRGGSGSSTAGQRGDPSGHGCGTLPSLRSPRAARAARQVVVGVRTVELEG